MRSLKNSLWEDLEKWEAAYNTLQDEITVLKSSIWSLVWCWQRTELKACVCNFGYWWLRWSLSELQSVSCLLSLISERPGNRPEHDFWSGKEIQHYIQLGFKELPEEGAAVEPSVATRLCEVSNGIVWDCKMRATTSAWEFYQRRDDVSIHAEPWLTGIQRGPVKRLTGMVKTLRIVWQPNSLRMWQPTGIRPSCPDVQSDATRWDMIDWHHVDEESRVAQLYFTLYLHQNEIWSIWLCTNATKCFLIGFIKDNVVISWYWSPNARHIPIWPDWLHQIQLVFLFLCGICCSGSRLNSSHHRIYSPLHKTNM